MFAVGADTITRVADARFYGDRGEDRDGAIDEIARLGCRFLVFGRADQEGFQELDDLSLPDKLRAICDGVPGAEFRIDISSTELRGGH